MDVLTLEDHPEAQAWLARALHEGFDKPVVITPVYDIHEALRQLGQRAFDLFIADLHLPDGNGTEAIIHAKQRYPEMPCVVATIYSDDQHLFPALKAGADGYILKEEDTTTIAQMLRGINNGDPPLSAEIAGRLLLYFQQTGNNSSKSGDRTQLTARERETLQFLVKGFSIRECGELMGISAHTVSGHVKEIYKKLHVSSRAEVVTEALRLGLLD